MRYYKMILLVLVVGILSACNRYIDTVRGKNAYQSHGSFTFYPDSNMFFFKGGLPLKADNEVYYPKAFKIKVPKKLRTYSISNSEGFGFYYDSKQVIYIKIDLMNDKLAPDTVYSPSESELTNFIEHKLYSTNGKYDIRKIAPETSRKQLILKKGSATILLFNILPENYDRFLQDVESFEFASQ